MLSSARQWLDRVVMRVRGRNAVRGWAPELWLVYWTAPSQGEAERIIGMLLEQRLIACANITQGTSVYTWQSKNTHEPEWYILAKTTRRSVKAIKSFIAQVHPYQAPAILDWPAGANELFATWVRGELAR